MKKWTPQAGPVFAYLLGNMPAGERAAFEERLFGDDALFAEMCDAENDLIDALARGELPEDIAAKVRTMLRDSSQRERDPFAAAFAKRANRGNVLIRREWLVLAACLVLAALSASLFLRDRSLTSQLAQALRQNNAQAAGRNALFSAALNPGVVRGEQTAPAIEPPAGARVIELRLRLRGAASLRSQGSYDRYRVDLSPESGRPVLSELLPAARQELRVAVSRELLPAGAYEIAISGVNAAGSEPVDSYHFVIR
jgi:hypothetical protein